MHTKNKQNLSTFKANELKLNVERFKFTYLNYLSLNVKN